MCDEVGVGEVGEDWGGEKPDSLSVSTDLSRLYGRTGAVHEQREKQKVVSGVKKSQCSGVLN